MQCSEVLKGQEPGGRVHRALRQKGKRSVLLCDNLQNEIKKEGPCGFSAENNGSAPLKAAESHTGPFHVRTCEPVVGLGVPGKECW